ncbi:hypothetical protein [Streptomyces ossamyceticus]|jgi:hypothetical protein|uniref:hypothetical protein n=1 Tax=Streptomyces ossamyceticus TaxID=249581 RepID=UPI003EBA11E7
MSEPFSLADAEATFGPDNAKRVRDSVAAAPPWSPEQVMALRALFAASRVERPADPAADAA